MSDENYAVQLAKVEQIVENIDKNVQSGFTIVTDRIEKLDGKFEMSQKDINDLDKRVSRNEEFIKFLKWGLAIAGGIIVAAATYASISGFVEYVSTHGVP